MKLLNKYIYVSRSKAKNRKILNNEKVEAVFEKYGFKILNFEEHSFYEQVYLLKNYINTFGRP